MIDQKEACVLATLFLHTSGAEVTRSNIQKILGHVGVQADGYLVDLFAKINRSTLESIIGNPAAAGMAAPAAAAEAPAAPEEKKEEEEEEPSDEDFGLF